MGSRTLNRFRQVAAVSAAVVVAINISFVSAGAVVADATSTPVLTPSCPADFTVVPLVSRTYLADGGYSVDGSGVDVPVPPPGFAPLQAPAAQLAEYGLPARPTTVGQVAAWTETMQSWRRTDDAGLCQGPSGLRFGSSVNGKWSGMAVSASSNTWTGISAWVTQPTFNSAGCSSSSEVSWVGIGGWGYPQLIQDGTYMEQGPKYWAFYEYFSSTYSSPVYTLGSVTVHPGDVMYSYVYYDSSTSQVEFYVQDETNGTNQTYWLSGASSYYNGKTIEFIDEKPWTSLSDFNMIPWSNTMEEQTNGTWYDLGNQNPTTIIMEKNNTVEAMPTGMTSSTTFRDYWYAC
jgi:hypothetical protein